MQIKTHDQVKEMANAHWGYVAEMLSTGAPVPASYAAIDMIGVHYRAAMIHGYKHALQDMGITNPAEHREPARATVKISKLVPHAHMPARAYDRDAGADLMAISKTRYGDDWVEYGTGLAIEIPDGYAGLLFPRSSISQYDMALCNSVGVADPGYTGEVTFRFRILKADADKPKLYDIGDRIGQLIIVPCLLPEFETVRALAPSMRGANGYGSSDRMHKKDDK